MELRLISEAFQNYPNPQGLNYSAFNPIISNEVQSNIIEIFQTRVNKFIDEVLTEINFNPSGQETDEYSVCPYEYVGNFEDVIELFNDAGQEELPGDDISFLIHRLRVNNDGEEIKYIYLFRRNQKMKNLRKGFWLRKIREEYDVLDSELIGIDGFIDAIAFEGEIAFFSHISAERIFNLREKFAENAQSVLDEIRDFDVFDNFDEFFDDCLNDARVTRRLTKIHYNPVILELFNEHFENAPEVIEEFDLNITFDEENNRIVYEGKEQLSDITMLLRDAYYKTVLANRKGVDDYNN
ncbi:Kiwa anti-phage protein KwaB-like domain-containing protein [Viridibacillus arvi]|uniref:Kiwa anti-phage protein KwaB-like domain-containing protein n=1 Tax=Viridibacillus arvi TaxID=263475 RepID=UPI003D0288FB